MTFSIAGFDLPHSSDRLLHRVLTAALPDRNCGDRTKPYWDASFFQLNQVTLFQDCTIDEQLNILDRASHSLLEEAYSIEKAGVGYMAKMVLLSETQEERMLYSLFAADETQHLHQLCQFLLQIESIAEQTFFLQLLSQVIEEDDKALLLFVVQIILEGWGLSHYRRLSQCRDRALSNLFSSFLQAESRHHATGAILFDQVAVSSISQAKITAVLSDFLYMVRLGPQSVLAAIEQVKGHLSRFQKIQILEQLNAINHSGIRLQLLRSLMQRETTESIVSVLEAQGAFEPLSPHQCVS